MSHPLLLAALSVAAQDPAAAPPTFTQHVAPIVFAHCTVCHRPGEVAPFPLQSYADVRKRAPTIAEVVADRFMPPWHPVAGHGEFRGELRLGDAAVATIARWVDAGCPEGPADALPALPEFPAGWALGEPDLVVRTRQPFPVPAAGPDIYRNFTIPLEIDGDRWIRAIAVRTAARDVLHHVLFFLDATGEGRRVDGRGGAPGFAGMRLARQPTVGGWAVGGRPEPLPDGLGVPLPRGNDLILQCHFHPSGRAVEEQLTIGLYFTEREPERTLVPIQLPPYFGMMAGIDIAAGEGDYRLHDALELPCAVDAITVGGHAHMLCRRLRMWAVLPAGAEARGEPVQVPLLRIDDWDFDWQNRYTYVEPVRLPAGAVIHSELVYDNSDANPANPNRPPVRVRWGRESTDEMGSVTLMVAPADERDLDALRAAVRGHARRAALRRVGRFDPARLLERYDGNGDGTVERGEVPARQRAMFDRLDTDGDGRIDKAELERLLNGRGR